MDAAQYRIRAPERSDFEAEARIWNRVSPGDAYSPGEMEHDEKVFSIPPNIQVKVVAEHRGSGEAIGFGYLNSDPESFDPRGFWVGVMVDPDHQRRGIGRALAAAVDQEARSRQAVSLIGAARLDDERGVRFLARQGFTEVRRRWRSRLEVGTASPSPDRTGELAEMGIILTTLAEEGSDRPDVLHRAWELFNSASADEPRAGPFTPISFELFVEWNRGSISKLPEAFFLAREGERYVGMCNLELLEAEPDCLHQLFTGTDPSRRGRGIATALKRRTVEFAQQRGYRYIRTSNDSLNRPMWAINEKMGFRREKEEVEARKYVTGGGPDSPPASGAPNLLRHT